MMGADDIINLLPLSDLREFRMECMKEDVEEKAKTFRTDFKLLGMEVWVTMVYKRPKLTPEEERMIEESVGRAWDIAHGVKR